MLSQEMQDALNKQINEELESSYLYQAMACYFEHNTLRGFANWMRIQTEEERGHAQKLINYMQDRGARVKLTGIQGPKADWKDSLAVFEDALEHERHISQCINKIQSQAIKEGDHATHALLEWFVTEQVEEEANASAIVDQLKLVEGAPGGLFLLDREMAQRSMPAAGAE